VEPRGPYVDRNRYNVLAAYNSYPQSPLPNVDFYVASRFQFEPDATGCKLFEIDAPWEGEAKRLMITKPC
jgi:hypothetical protein